MERKETPRADFSLIAAGEREKIRLPCAHSAGGIHPCLLSPFSLLQRIAVLLGPLFCSFPFSSGGNKISTSSSSLFPSSFPRVFHFLLLLSFPLPCLWPLREKEREKKERSEEGKRTIYISGVVGGREAGEGEGASADSSTLPPPQKTEWRRMGGGVGGGKGKHIVPGSFFRHVACSPRFCSRRNSEMGTLQFLPLPHFFPCVRFLAPLFPGRLPPPKVEKILGSEEKHISCKP